jgi:hypothetical protein
MKNLQKIVGQAFKELKNKSESDNTSSVSKIK